MVCLGFSLWPIAKKGRIERGVFFIQEKFFKLSTDCVDKIQDFIYVIQVVAVVFMRKTVVFMRKTPCLGGGVYAWISS